MHRANVRGQNPPVARDGADAAVAHDGLLCRRSSELPGEAALACRSVNAEAASARLIPRAPIPRRWSCRRAMCG